MIEPGDVLEHYYQAGDILIGFEILATDISPNLSDADFRGLQECPNCEGNSVCCLGRAYRSPPDYYAVSYCKDCRIIWREIKIGDIP